MSRMRNSWSAGVAAMVLMAAAAGTWAQSPAVKPKDAAPVAAAKGMDVLEGAWARPDGGYLILIKKVAADGSLEASYFNPKPLPFAKAQATRDGASLRVSLELQAGGYAGSTYELVYDAAGDRLYGTYYQAVAKKTYDVYFTRK